MEKFVSKLDSETKGRLKKAIEALENEPVPHNAVRVVGIDKTFRIRVGDFRVLYHIDYEEKVIVVVNIDKRSRVYD